MDVLIREVKILDPKSDHHKKTLNVLIKNGHITAIDTSNHKADQIIEAKGMLLSPGWLDMRANFNDPGNEHKEDIHSGCKAAARGGFTGVALLPNTEPVVQTKSNIEYLLSKSRNSVTSVHPIAAVTIDGKGEDLTEMLDLHHAGAVAFSDGDHPIWHTDIMLKTLIYLQKVKGLLINTAEDQMLTRFGTMHEGVMSTTLGMRGMPALAEHLMIKRDLDLLQYAGGKIHFSNVSSKESVELIKKGKKSGLNITCDVSISHLLFTDEAVLGYDTNYKINPPLREEKDRKTLIAGLKDDTIDAIVSSHNPQDEESKKLEFDKAEFGISTIQTVLPGLLSLGKELDPEIWLQKITEGPKEILGVDSPPIGKGSAANLTLFDPKEKWVLDNSTNASKSRNSPFFGKELTGRVKAVFNGDKQEIY